MPVNEALERSTPDSHKIGKRATTTAIPISAASQAQLKTSKSVQPPTMPGHEAVEPEAPIAPNIKANLCDGKTFRFLSLKFRV